MGRRPFRCYRTTRGKPFPKSRYNRAVPDPKLRLYEMGSKKKRWDHFPLCIHLVSLEKEQISNEALEAMRIAQNKYLIKKLGRENFHLKVRKHP